MYIGRRVAKDFNGTVFNGTVTKLLPDQLWHVKYNDGDSKDMDLDELKSALEQSIEQDKIYIGRRVAKVSGTDVLSGTIRTFLPAKRLWKVEYDDKNNDNEDMDIDDLNYALGLYDDIEASI